MATRRRIVDTGKWIFAAARKSVTSGQIEDTGEVDGLFTAVAIFKSKSPAQLEEYDRRNVGDGRMGFRVQQLIIRHATVFAVLPKGIVSLPLSSCHTVTSCSACISSPDPMCQWCTAVGKCTTANLCPSATASVCPLQNGPPSPTSLSVDDIRNITLPVKHLPQPDGFSYVCVFGSASSPASWTVDGVSCGLPVLRSSAADLPPSITDSLALSTSISSYRIVEHNFTVYNCGAFMTDCFQPEFFQAMVKCEAIKLNYPDLLPNITAPLEFIHGNDVIDRTEVSIYSCSLLAGDCSSCVFASARWGCSWCSGRCSHDCPQPSEDVICDRPQIVSVRPPNAIIHPIPPSGHANKTSQRKLNC
ncbi:unnamed protein product [Nippostrongylus brasiliensis]|uniref:PSI domain-containing protein n=1 Tax=Nippostrongylus brasiliensis TaxID=27835 RepID=A0A0N4YSV7_NIPBR|nr:unnamed protein product [Nippostrongylus brasiliensis]